MRKLIPEKKIVVCDFCGKEIFTNQKTGDQWSGVRFIIKKRAFIGLFGSYEKEIDLCADCYKKLTDKDYTHDWGEREE